MPRGIPNSKNRETPVDIHRGDAHAQGVFVARIDTAPVDLGALTYEELIRTKGAVRDPSTGRTVRFVPDGTVRPQKTKDGKWVQASDKRFIASSLEEAREKGMKWDFYATGLECKKHNCNQLISGWVRGGRKLEVEHAHIMADRYGVPDVMAVADPTLDQDE